MKDPNMSFIFFDFFGVLKDPKEHKITESLTEGMLDVVKNLQQSHSLFIVSTSYKNDILFYLENWNMKNLFIDVYGGDSGLTKAEAVQEICKIHKADVANGTFITDTCYDLEILSSLPLKTIAVTWGVDSHASLQEHSPNHIVNNPKEIITLLK